MGIQGEQLHLLGSDIQHAMRAEQRAFRNRLKRMRVRLKQGKDIQAGFEQLQRDIGQSRQMLEARKLRVPEIVYPADLPISQKRQLIADAIAKHQVVIVAGETGSGKTTQIPKICLELGRGIHAMIGHTQPRRIAARSVANRIAEELGSPLGTDVGYKVRFSDHSRNVPYIKLMTDGILLAEIQRDPKLLHYDTIIIDEAHERSLNIDFLLGYLKNILPMRPDLKLIVTSATINTARFSEFFQQAPIMEVSGRSYPVDIVYRPLEPEAKSDKTAESSDAQSTAFHQAVIAAVDAAADVDGLGDILIFLPGEREIRDTALALHQHSMRDSEILPLYSRLSPTEQDRVFKGHRGRRIVLATNVAETSLTVPGIRFVIDSGLARISRYSARSKVQRLPIEPISQASANQRAGRCGRVAAGVCFRLYSEADFKLRSEHTDPEIRRTHLASVILQMANLGLGRIHDFTFMDPPEKRAIGDGYRMLEELQAMQGESLTAIGKLLVRLPLDPRLGRMLLQAEKEGALAEVAIIVSALSVQDPRLRPADMAAQADAKHRLFRDDGSDFLSWLKLWQWYEEQSHQLSRSKLKKVCQQHFLAYMRMREWHDLHGQLLRVMAELNMEIKTQARHESAKREPTKPEAVHRAMLAGLLSHIAMRHPEKGLLGARNLKLTIFPASVLAKKPPTWLMAASLVETSRLFARDIAPIDPLWLESLAAHLIKRQYSEPHWSAKRAQVNVFETISLYGLPIVSKRRCHFGSIDAEVSRQLFIRHALVQHEFHTHGDFCKHNKRILSEIETMEHKIRRKDLLADEQARYDFFDARIPAGIYSGKLFEQWRKQAERQQPRLLFLDKAILLEGQPDGVDAALFPNRMQIEQLKLRISYHFDPGHQADGITVHVPMLALGQLDAGRFEWLVPGMLVEKLTLLIKGLPKAMRKNFVPTPQFAQACADSMVFGEGALLRAFSKQLQRMTGVQVPARSWNSDALPTHLRMNFSVLDEHGSSIAEDMNLALLQQRYAGQMRDALQRHPSVQDICRTGITRWDFDALPACVEQPQGRSLLQSFPALVDHQRSVAIELLESRQAADMAMCAGVRRLMMLSLNAQVKMLQQSFSKNKEITLYYAVLGHKSNLIDDIIIQAFDTVFMVPESAGAKADASIGLPRCRTDFEHILQTRKSHLVGQAEQVASHLHTIFKVHAALQQQLAVVRAAALKPVVADIQAQLEELMPDGFVRLIPLANLQHLPRYIEAAAVRLGRAGPNLKQDQANSQIMQILWQAYHTEYLQRQQHHEDCQPLNAFRWLLEELRVSLFAQNIKTAVPVSVKRLKKHWQEIITAG